MVGVERVREREEDRGYSIYDFVEEWDFILRKIEKI